jgi:hypothetical protein
MQRRVCTSACQHNSRNADNATKWISIPHQVSPVGNAVEEWNLQAPGFNKEKQGTAYMHMQYRWQFCCCYCTGLACMQHEPCRHTWQTASAHKLHSAKHSCSRGSCSSSSTLKQLLEDLTAGKDASMTRRTQLHKRHLSQALHAVYHACRQARCATMHTTNGTTWHSSS